MFFYFEILSKQYDGSPPFYMLVESPSSVRRGETLGIRLMAINNLKEEAIALIVLEASDDYLFVETDDDGEVEHYRPTLVGGERQHMIAVQSNYNSLDVIYLLLLYFRGRQLGEAGILWRGLPAYRSTGGSRNNHN